MPVYHFTVHAYRSWGPARERGYVQRGKGYLPRDEQMQGRYDARASQPPAAFDSLTIQQILVLGRIDVCRRRGWRLHIVVTDPQHLHWVVSWRGFVPWQEVRKVTKNILSLLLNRITGQRGRRWFVRDGSRKRVQDLRHLKHLMDTYLPDHRGLQWREGDPFPSDPFCVLST